MITPAPRRVTTAGKLFEATLGGATQSHTAYATRQPGLELNPGSLPARVTECPKARCPKAKRLPAFRGPKAIGASRPQGTGLCPRVSSKRGTHRQARKQALANYSSQIHAVGSFRRLQLQLNQRHWL